MLYFTFYPAGSSIYSAGSSWKKLLDIARGKSGHSSALLSVNLTFKFLEYTVREIKPILLILFLCAQVDFFFILTVPCKDVILLKYIVISRNNCHVRIKINKLISKLPLLAITWHCVFHLWTCLQTWLTYSCKWLNDLWVKLQSIYECIWFQVCFALWHDLVYLLYHFQSVISIKCMRSILNESLLLQVNALLYRVPPAPPQKKKTEQSLF